MDMKYVRLCFLFDSQSSLITMNSKGEAFEMGDFRWQARMMDALMTAL